MVRVLNTLAASRASEQTAPCSKNCRMARNRDVKVKQEQNPDWRVITLVDRQRVEEKKKICPWPAVIHVFIFLFSNISIAIDLRWLLRHSCQSQLVYGLDPSIHTDPGGGPGVSID